LFNIKIVLDSSCTQLNAICNTKPDEFNVKPTTDATDINIGPVMNHKAGAVCQYKLQITKGKSYGDPIIIVR
jgi:hypothetical protein